MEKPIYVCEVCRMPTGMMERNGMHVMMSRCPRHLDMDMVEREGYTPVRFHPNCPPLFRMTNIERLPEKLRQAARSWEPGVEHHSLLLHGTTGTGKTRTAWCIANRLWSAKASVGVRHRLLFLTMPQLTEQITSSFSEDRGHERLMDGLNGCELLVMDDLGKEKMTPRVVADLFALVDHRANHLKPTIITTNFNGTGLSARFEDAEMGAAFVRRLRDYYHAIGA